MNILKIYLNLDGETYVKSDVTINNGNKVFFVCEIFAQYTHVVY